MEEKEKNEVKQTSEEQKNKDKKYKNLISIIILLSGLLIGSVFVDIIQFIQGKGFSEKKLLNSDILRSNNKTWVAYDDPIVKVDIVNDDSCETCKAEETIMWLKQAIPTILIQKIDVNSQEGKEILSEFKVKTIPVFIFSKEVENIRIFQQIKNVFVKNNERYLFDAVRVGAPVGRYLEIPKITDEDIKIGKNDAKVKIIEFSDFQCPSCRVLHESVKKIIEEHQDNLLYVYKHFPLNFHQQAENAALASECANEQEKFMLYVDKIFANQGDWNKSQGTQKFKSYARELGLNVIKFNDCLDNKKYLDKIKKDWEEGRNFNIAGTPSIFINQQFQSGALDYEALKKIIDQELAK